MLTFISALIISLVSIPQIMLISAKKRLFDLPDNDRKIHLRVVPNLGGIGIFFAFITTCSLFLNHDSFSNWNYIIASSLILFLTGIMDDLVSLSPSKKFFAQFIAASITVCIADIRLSSLHGIFGVYDLTYWYSIIFSVVGIIFVINAFNLIDGIDGLAGSIGVLSTFSLGVCLAASGNAGGASMAFSLMGAIAGFLRFNTAPARIFMGDTGALLIGYIISVLCILFANSYNEQTTVGNIIHNPGGALVVGLSVLFVPVFDSFRVFATRLMRGVSPFKADRTHLHHYLLDLGFTHSMTVGILLISNILLITVALILQDFNPNLGIFGIVAVSFILYAILYFMRKKRMESIKLLKGQSKPTIGNSKVSATGIYHN
ncbi:MAG: undecaprenyl/decaprenyl-phosphate alpha-N-acetylglucosaminyl 1-phosphate transferase [Flavipsychrobacter sp.]|nr:undecaprenyl/decaprenyl-phosphate alpha-N-acetylglucosaminyl 1-phosphate transferase [Flavipsychrobacter sp.]